MYCERCGKHIDDALNFCISCGAQIKKEKGEKQSVLTALITALIVVSTAGLGVLVGLMAILLDKLANPEPAFVFALFYLATLFGIAFMIMRQISKLIDVNVRANENDVPRMTGRDEPLVQLPPRSTNQLEEFRQPASVTDSTTRTLDKIPVRER